MARTLPPVQAIRAEIDALFTEGRDLVEVIEDVARLGARHRGRLRSTHGTYLVELFTPLRGRDPLRADLISDAALIEGFRPLTGGGLW